MWGGAAGGCVVGVQLDGGEDGHFLGFGGGWVGMGRPSGTHIR